MDDDQMARRFRQYAYFLTCRDAYGRFDPRTMRAFRNWHLASFGPGHDPGGDWKNAGLRRPGTRLALQGSDQ